MAPACEQAARQLEPDFRVGKVDTEAVPNLAKRFNIRSISTLALFVDGRELARQPGAMGAADMVRWARSHLR
jgi:thioredoxin 2